MSYEDEFDYDAKPVGRPVFDRVPPQNIEAERAVLGAILINPDVVGDAVEILGQSEEQFYVEAHQVLFKAILGLSRRRSPIDSVTIMQRLAQDGALEAAGGVSYIAGLTGAVPTSANIEAYAQMVADAAMLRKVISVCSRITAEAYAPKGSAEKLLADAVLEVSQVATSNIRTKIGTAFDGVELAVEKIESLTRKRESHVFTGIKNIDGMVSFAPGSFTVIGGRPSVGKTALAATICYNIAKRGEHVLFFSLEMETHEITERLFYSIGQMEKRKIQDGSMSEDEVVDRLNYVMDDRSLDRIHIDPSPRQSVISIIARTKRLMAKQRLSAVVVDYLQLIDTGRSKEKSRREEVDGLSRELKIAAREIGVPLIVLCQLSRESERDAGPPKLSHFRESGAIEQDADNALMLWRLQGMTIGCNVAKQRNGPTGIVCLNFDRDTQTYRDSAERYDWRKNKLVNDSGEPVPPPEGEDRDGELVW